MDDNQRAVPENIVAQRVFRRELDGLSRGLRLVLYQGGAVVGGLLLLIGLAFYFSNIFSGDQPETNDSLRFIGLMAFVGAILFALSLALYLRVRRMVMSTANLAKAMPVNDVAVVLAEKYEGLWSAEIARQLFVVQKETRFASLYLAVQYPFFKVEPNFSILNRIDGVERLALLDFESRNLAARNAILVGIPIGFFHIGVLSWFTARLNLNGHPLFELIQIALNILLAGLVVYFVAKIRQKGDPESEELLSELSNEELFRLNGWRLGMLARKVAHSRGGMSEA